ncbi:MAG: FtsX-like permease family protein [Acidimicrobiales bacterium]
MHSALVQFTWYRFRTTFRRRVGGYVVLVLVVGLIGGVAIGVITGARRTQSALPTSLATSHASDLQFSTYIGGCRNPATCLYSAKFTREIERLPHVRHVAGNVQMLLAPVGKNGKPYLPYAFANNVVNTIGSFGGEYFTQDRVIADEGRVPNPASSNEFAVTAETARILGWHVGETIPLAAYTFAAAFSSNTPLPSSPPAARFKMKLVGIVAFDDAVVHDEVDRYPTFALLTPVVSRLLISSKAAGFADYALVLDGGSKNVPVVERELIGLLPKGSTYQFHVTSVVEGQVERATEPVSIALAAFGVIAALAALLIASQAIGRAIRSNRRDLEILRACGADRVMITADSFFGLFGAILIGAFLALAVGLALTPLFPIGAVRQVDPSPGIDVDWTVLGSGFGVAMFLLSVIALLYAAASIRRGSAPDPLARMQNSSAIVDRAARTGLPPAAIAGIRFAVARGHGRDSVPVGSAFLGASLAVLVLVTTVTFGDGLSTLVSHPKLYGWNWNYAIEEVGSGNVPGALSDRLLRQDRYVASWTEFGFANPQIDGLTVPAMLTNSRTPISPPILSGHGLQNVHQIVLGGATLSQLHKRVGDWVVVSYGTPKDAPAYVPPTRVRIVGTATFPAIGDSGTLHPSMGAGALILEDIAPLTFRRYSASKDPLQNGEPIVVIRLHEGTPPRAALASLQHIAERISKAVQTDPNSGGGTFEVLSVQQPAEIVNYKTMGSTPALLASGLAVAAAFALGLTLFASVRRRRRDLALLKTLGFVRRQLSAAVLWQASIAAAVGVVIGVPLGVIVGRTLWGVFAREIYAVPRPTVPVVPIVLVAIGAIVLANVVAYLPGQFASRTATAPSLRAE